MTKRKAVQADERTTALADERARMCEQAKELSRKFPKPLVVVYQMRRAGEETTVGYNVRFEWSNQEPLFLFIDGYAFTPAVAYQNGEEWVRPLARRAK